jgi:hypothetical protein
MNATPHSENPLAPNGSAAFDRHLVLCFTQALDKPNKSTFIHLQHLANPRYPLKSTKKNSEEVPQRGNMLFFWGHALRLPG